MKIIEYIKKLFHRHDIVWTSRKLVERVSVDTSIGSIIEFEDANVYVYEGYCIKCGETVVSKKKFLEFLTKNNRLINL